MLLVVVVVVGQNPLSYAVLEELLLLLPWILRAVQRQAGLVLRSS